MLLLNLLQRRWAQNHISRCSWMWIVLKNICFSKMECLCGLPTRSQHDLVFTSSAKCLTAKVSIKLPCIGRHKFLELNFLLKIRS